MKRIAGILFLVCILLPIHAQSLKIMSYNIRNATGIDQVRDYDRIAKVIARIGPDVVAIQEIDSVTHRSQGDDVLQELAKRTNLFAFYAPTIPYDGGKYGIGMLSKQKPLSATYRSLPGQEEQRVLFIAEFNDFIFCGTHLSLTQEDRIASIELIKESLSKLAETKPLFLAGDFNDYPDSPFIQQLKEDFDILSDTSLYTFPAPHPQETIDYIAIMKRTPQKIKVKKATVVNEPMASDHRPILVKLKIK